MKNKFKTFSIILLALIFAFSSLLMVGCKNDNANPVSISDDGYWVINGEKTEIKATGEKGDAGRDGRPGNAGKGIASVEKTTDDETGVDTYTITYTDGSRYVFDVANGVTPTIEIIGGEWWINGENTHMAVAGQGDPGQDGHEVEFRTTETHIQWRYVDNEQDEDENWEDLVALADIKGADGQGTPGSDGREVEFQVADGYIQWRYKTDNDSEEWANLIALEDIKGDDGSNGTQGNPGHDGREVEFRTNETYIQWRYVDANQGEDENWTNLVALEDIKGDDGSNGGQGTPGSDGREVEFQVANGYIQWRYKTADDSEEWINLIALSDITGQDGQDTSYELYTITFDYHGTEELFDFSSSDDEIAESINVKSSEWLNGKLPELKENYNGFLLGWFIKGTNVRLGKYDFIGGNVTLEPIFDFNSLLNALKLFNSKHNTLQDVIDDIKEFGIDLVEYDAGFDTDLTRLVWDSVNDQIYLYIAEENDIDTLKAKQTEEVKEINCFTIYHADDYEIVEESENEYSIDLTNEITSVYLAYNEELNGVIVRTDKGLDVGENENIKEVDYYNVIIAENPEDYAQTVIIRMNGGTLDITAPYDTVNKYGIIDNLNINSVANNSYHEYGITGFAAIAEGRIVLTEDALIGAVHVVASEVFDSENGETEFRPVVLTAINNASIPTITRDEVTLESGADNKVKVFEIQQINTTGEEVEVNSAFVYIVKDEGSGEESAIVTMLNSSNAEVELDLTDTTNPATVLAATIAGSVEESKTIEDAEVNSGVRFIRTVEELATALQVESATVILKADIKSESKITIANNTTFDLNGYTLTANILVSEGANFTLMGEGTLTAPNNTYTINNQGTTTITANAQGKAPIVTIFDNGGSASLIENGWYENADAVGKTAIMIINAGRFEGGLNTIKNDAGGVLEINDGEFVHTSTTNGTATILNWNVATINGGRFSSETKVAFSNNYVKNDTTSIGQFTVNYAEVEGKSTFSKSSASGTPFIQVYGGIYIAPLGSGYMINNELGFVDGFVAGQENELTVIPNGYYAVVHNTNLLMSFYSTEEQAIANSKAMIIDESGEMHYYATSATALNNITDNVTFVLNDNIAFNYRGYVYAYDLNGFTSNAVSLGTSASVITIKDTSIEQTGIFNFNNKKFSAGTIIIEGGNIVGLNPAKITTGTLIVRGGVFDADPTDYVDLTEYNVTKSTVDEVETWTVTAKTRAEVSTVSEIVQARAEGIEYIMLTGDIIFNGQLSFNNDTIINLNNHTLKSNNNVALSANNGATLTIIGDGNVEAQEGCVMAFHGSTIIINGGTYTCYDNFVIGTNGTVKTGDDQGHNSIIINGGVFNGGIQSAGYVACGIYVANSDTVKVNAGTFNITNGVGILARSGNTTVGENVVFNVAGNGVLGKVGDSKVTVPSGEELVLDLAANYPGGEPTLTNNSEYSIYHVANIANISGLNFAIQNGGYYILTADVTYSGQASFSKDTMINLNGYKLESTNDVALSASSGATLTLEGEGNVVAQEACVMAFDGSTVIINGGTYTARDNFVIGTNGSAGRGENTITINGGVFNGNIQTTGYIACGIYAANNDTIAVNAGTFNITNGTGIVVRAGNVTIGKEVLFNCTNPDELADGKVGDSRVAIPAGKDIAIELHSNYPGFVSSGLIVTNYNDCTVWTNTNGHTFTEEPISDNQGTIYTGTYVAN